LTIITNSEADTITTMSDIKAWLTSNSIDITGKSASLSIDHLGYVQEFDVDVTIAAPEIESFKNIFFNKRIQGNRGLGVSSAGTITLTNGNFYDITGITTINYITTTNWKPGSMICLKFHSSITIKHNSSSVPTNTASLFLNSNIDFDFKAGSTLTLVYDGEYWREMARMESSP